MEPEIIQRDQHPLSRQDISPEALKVLYRLKDAGFKAYLAGGCVRDLLLGRTPKDFDIATNATPEEVKDVFQNCRIIGRRFRLAHVYYRGGLVIEVATFRATVENADNSSHVIQDEEGKITRDNQWGTPEQDALRRDFTINALFYNIADYSIIDYARALPDIESRTLHCIGDPDVRYAEDPVRMIRAIRFAATLDLNVEDNTWAAIHRNRERIRTSSNARLYEEMLKFFYSGAAARAFELLEECGLLDQLFPEWGPWLQHAASEGDRARTRAALELFDKWKAHHHVAPQPLLFSLLFSPYHEHLAEQLVAGGKVREAMAMHDAVDNHHAGLVKHILIPKRILFEMRHILVAQPRFARATEASARKLSRRHWFRDALIYYKFNVGQGHGDRDALEWWEAYMKENPPPEPERRRKRPRRPRRRRPPRDNTSAESASEAE